MKIDKKTELLNKLKQSAQSNGLIDITRFRKENPKEYNLLPHHFGSVNDAVNLAGLTIVRRRGPADSENISIRNLLIYDMFHVFFECKLPIDLICQYYGCASDTLAKLFVALYDSSPTRNPAELEYFTRERSEKEIYGHNKQIELGSRLALHMLNNMRNGQNMTLEEIGNRYKCTRAAIDQLHRSLKVKKPN